MSMSPMDAGGDRSRVADLPEDFYTQIKGTLQQRIAERLGSARHVLDVGCGSCDLARFLATNNRQHVVGVDVSDHNFPDQDLDDETVECHRTDARRLAFVEDRSFDAAVSVYALHEMDKPVEVLTEVKRVLRTGAVVLLVDFPRGSLAERLWQENYYTVEEVRVMLKRAGFRPTDLRRIAQRQIIWAEGVKGPDDRRRAVGLREELHQLKRKVAVLDEQAHRLRDRIDRIAAGSREKQCAVVDRVKCTGCGLCERVCPTGAITVTSVASVDSERCTACGVCAENCPQNAIRLHTQ